MMINCCNYLEDQKQCEAIKLRKFFWGENSYQLHLSMS
jgi:hypothetical protein